MKQARGEEKTKMPKGELRRRIDGDVEGWIYGEPNTFLEKNFLSSPAI